MIASCIDSHFLKEFEASQNHYRDKKRLCKPKNGPFSLTQWCPREKMAGRPLNLIGEERQWPFAADNSDGYYTKVGQYAALRKDPCCAYPYGN
jgi:hypothetical protein